MASQRKGGRSGDRRPGRRLSPRSNEQVPAPYSVPAVCTSTLWDSGFFEPTAEQRAILDHHYDTGDVAKIEAVAGSGKTTVLRKLVHTHALRRCTLYLVFSRALQVAESLYMGCTANSNTVTVATLDSLAFQHTRQHHGGRVVSVLAISPEDVRFEPHAFMQAVSETIETFAQSIDLCIDAEHVPARLPRRADGSAYEVLYVVDVAVDVWSQLCCSNTHLTMTYTVCMKLFQLRYTDKV